MRLVINGREEEREKAASLAELLLELEVDARSVAVARNRALVPRDAYSSTALEPGDEIEILTPMQGG